MTNEKDDKMTNEKLEIRNAKDDKMRKMIK